MLMFTPTYVCKIFSQYEIFNIFNIFIKHYYSYSYYGLKATRMILTFGLVIFALITQEIREANCES